MPNAMQIDLRLGGVDAAVAGLERVAAAFDRVTKSQGGGGSSSGGTRISVPSSDATKYLQGPNQRLQKIAEQLKAAEAEQNQAAIDDLKILQFRAQRSKILGERRLAQGQEALNQPGLLDLFGDLNRIMRGLTSGNLGQTVRSLGKGIDLIGTGGLNIEQKLANAVTAPAAGGGAAGALEKLSGVVAGLSPELLLIGGAIVGGVAIAVAGLKQLAEETVRAAQRLGQIGAASSTSGGRSGDIFGLGAFGVAPNQVAGAAGGLRERLASDPFARMAGADLGLDPQIPAILGGSQNNARVLREALTALRGITDQEEQLMQARRLGLEAYVDELRVSERVFQLRRRQAESEEALFGEGTPFIQHSRDLNAELDITGRQMEDLRNAFATPFIEDAAAGLHGLNTILMSFGVTAQGLGGWAKDMLFDFGGLLGILTEIGNLMDLINGKSPKQQAEDEHARAMREHTAALARASAGIGPRGNAGYPVNLRGEMQRQAMAADTMRFGAFAP